jgi:hypothetical protein
MSILGDIDFNLDNGSAEMLKQSIFEHILKETCRLNIVDMRNRSYGRAYKYNSLNVIRGFAKHTFSCITLGDLIKIFNISFEDVELLKNKGIIGSLSREFETVRYIFEVRQNLDYAINVLKSDETIDITKYTCWPALIKIVTDKPRTRCCSFNTPYDYMGLDIIEVHPDVADMIGREIKRALFRTHIIFNDDTINEFSEFLSNDTINEFLERACQEKSKLMNKFMINAI